MEIIFIYFFLGGGSFPLAPKPYGFTLKSVREPIRLFRYPLCGDTPQRPAKVPLRGFIFYFGKSLYEAADTPKLTL